jgi:outer membrane pore protein F
MNKIFVILIPSLILTGITNAAEIYNKDSNKLDLYGKVVGEHNFTTGNVGGPDNSHDSSYAQLGFKG